MFCKKCGTELKGSEKFCGKCGTPVGQANQSVVTGKEPVSSIVKSTQVDGPLAITVIVAAVCQLIMLVLRFVSFGKYRLAVEGSGMRHSGTCSLNELLGSTGETTIFIILVLISMALCILPIIKNSLGKRQRMILPKIAAFWNAFMVGMGIWGLADYVARNKENIAYNFREEYFSGSWSLTFGGWINIIITLVTIVLLFIISKKTKNYNQ